MNNATLTIIPLDEKLIQQANHNSFGGNRGKVCNDDYQAYGREILDWPIADSRKEKLLQELHRRFSAMLNYEAQHVSVAVAGASKYNAKRLDKGEQIIKAGADFTEWYKELKRQVEEATKEDDRKEQLIKAITFLDQRPELDPTNRLAELATVDNAKFVELFESMVDKYRWRKNSTIYKLYLASKAGRSQGDKKGSRF